MTGLLLGTASLLAQASPAPDKLVVAGGQLESVWDFIVKGGPTMIVILLCSLLALTIVVERLIVLRRKSVIPPDFVSGLRAFANDKTRALEYARANGSPIANILAAALRRRGQRLEAVEKSVEEAGRREMVRLRQRMRVLGALPQVSTMLGLLGTIFGMIKTFQAVAASGQSLGKTELLAKGIFEAWTCTAAGLLVAIPVMVFYHFLMGRIDGLAVEMDKVAVDWLEEQTTGAPPQTTAPAPRTAIEPEGSSVAVPAGAMPAVAGGGA